MYIYIYIIVEHITAIVTLGGISNFVHMQPKRKSRNYALVWF